MEPSGSPVNSSLRTALLATALAFAWQSLTVHYNYQGNWTALFCTGSAFAVPPLAEFQGTYMFSGSTGYDGQFYRYVAHDPLDMRGLSRWVDAPRLRYTRIFTPLAAYTAALGMPGAVDGAYYAVTLGFLFLGVYWGSRYAVECGHNAMWGLGFLLVPAVLVSLDRMTVDMALAALCCGWARCWGRGKRASAGGYALLAALPLVRECGVLVSVASMVRPIRERRLRDLAWCALTLLPCAGWYGFVVRHTGPVSPRWASSRPLGGWMYRMLNPVAYPASVPLRPLVIFLDYAALAGILLAAVFAALLWLRHRNGTTEAALVLFAALVVQGNWTELWTDAFAFGRVFSPLLLLLAFKALEMRKAWPALPLALVTGRILAQFGAQIPGMLS